VESAVEAGRGSKAHLARISKTKMSKAGDEEVRRMGKIIDTIHDSCIRLEQEKKDKLKEIEKVKKHLKTLEMELGLIIEEMEN